jgi:hypothetical protein
MMRVYHALQESSMRRMFKITAAVVAFGLTSSSCMGSFGLTRTLYGFNQNMTGSSVINHLVFWALIFLLPLYELAVLGDLFILNVIEFWTGSKLLASVEKSEDGSMRITRGDDIYEARPVGEKRVEVWKGAERVGAVEMTDTGDLVVENARGELGVVPARVIEQMGPMLGHR